MNSKIAIQNLVFFCVIDDDMDQSVIRQGNIWDFKSAKVQDGIDRKLIK